MGSSARVRGRRLRAALSPPALRGLPRRPPQPGRRLASAGSSSPSGSTSRSSGARLDRALRLHPSPAGPPGPRARARLHPLQRHQDRRDLLRPHRRPWAEPARRLQVRARRPRVGCGQSLRRRHRAAGDHRHQRRAGAPQRRLHLEPRQRARAARAGGGHRPARPRSCRSPTSPTSPCTAPPTRRATPPRTTPRDVERFLAAPSRARAPLHLHRPRLLLHHRRREADPQRRLRTRHLGDHAAPRPSATTPCPITTIRPSETRPRAPASSRGRPPIRWRPSSSTASTGRCATCAGSATPTRPGRPLWVDEFGNTACGGVVGLLEHVRGQLLLPQRPRHHGPRRVRVATRWTLAGPQPYALVDETTLTPRPDYWAALLWRRLMGTTGAGPARERCARDASHLLELHPGVPRRASPPSRSTRTAPPRRRSAWPGSAPSAPVSTASPAISAPSRWRSTAGRSRSARPAELPRLSPTPVRRRDRDPRPRLLRLHHAAARRCRAPCFRR